MTTGGFLRGVNHQPAQSAGSEAKWDQLNGNRSHLKNSWLLLQELSRLPHCQRLEHCCWLLSQQACCLTRCLQECFCLEATQDLGLNHLWSLFQLLFGRSWFFWVTTSNPPYLLVWCCCVPGRSHLGEGEGEEETSFEAQHGDDTREASALPDWGLDWKDKVEIHTLCLVTGKQMVSQAWIFHSPCYVPPSG